MRTILAAVASLLGLVPSGIMAQEAGGLPAVLAAAEANHPVLRRQEADLRVAAESVAAARSAYRPNVVARASVFATERDARLTNGGDFKRDDTQQEASIGLEQTLYDGGRRSLRSQIAVLTLRGAEARYEEVRRQVLASVAGDYFAYNLARREILLNEALVSLLEEELKGARARVRAGDASQTDVATTRSRLELARSQVFASTLDRDVALQSLVSVTELEPALLSDDEQAFPACEIATAEEVLPVALARDPALAAAKIQTALSKAEALLARRTNAPVVSLAARASTAREVSPAIAENDELSVGVSVSVPLYSGGRAASARRRTAAQLRSVGFSEREARRQAELRTRQLLAQLDAARAALDAQRLRREASVQASEGVSVGRGVGFYSTLDVLDASAEGISADIAVERTTTQIRSLEFNICLLIE